MSSGTITAETNTAESYRALSTAAVACLVLGVASIITTLTAVTGLFACLATLPIPIVGVLLGWRGLAIIRKMPEEYTGKNMAIVGMGLCLFFALTGVPLAAYTYATEVPEGYERVSFTEFQPDEQQRREGETVPAEILELDGKKVFIKGFMRPSSQKMQLSNFLLVRDNNECCFGESIPAYYDRVQVRLLGDLRANYSLGVFRTAGVLRVHPENASRGSQFPVFTLDADHLK